MNKITASRAKSPILEKEKDLIVRFKVFNKKLGTYKETGKHGLYTVKGAIDTNVSWEHPDFRLTRQKLQNSYFKYIQRAEGNLANKQERARENLMKYWLVMTK